MYSVQRAGVTLGRLAWGAGFAVSIGLAGASQAQAPSASVNAAVLVNNAGWSPCAISPRTTLFGPDSIPPSACFVPVTLPGVGPSTRSMATIGARSLVPSVFDPLNPASYQLAKLGTQATISSQVIDWRTGLNQRNTIVQAAAFAQYTDYLHLGPVRPVSMRLTFDLSGGLSIDPIYTGMFGGSAYAETRYSVYAQSGRYNPSDSSFGSFQTYGSGDLNSMQSISAPGQTPTFATFVNQGAPGQFAATDRVHPNPLVRNTRRVTVDLGSDFFSNPINDILGLNLGLFSRVDAPLWLIDPSFGPGGYMVDVSSNFFNTFEMVGIEAFDANGVDITSDAVLGFGSMNPPAPVDPDPTDPGTVVPEPRSVVLMATGLLGVLAVGRRRRRARAG